MKNEHYAEGYSDAVKQVIRRLSYYGGVFTLGCAQDVFNDVMLSGAGANVHPVIEMVRGMAKELGLEEAIAKHEAKMAAWHAERATRQRDPWKAIDELSETIDKRTGLGEFTYGTSK